jgi:hypothetical protein
MARQKPAPKFLNLLVIKLARLSAWLVNLGALLATAWYAVKLL